MRNATRCKIGEVKEKTYEEDIMKSYLSEIGKSRSLEGHRRIEEMETYRVRDKSGNGVRITDHNRQAN